VLSFTSIAMMIYPAIYGLILAATGSYEVGFVLAAVPSFAAFVIFLNPSFQGSWFGFCLRLGRRLFSRPALTQIAMIMVLGLAFGLVFQALGF
jgi:hypothetical protein